MKLLSVQCVLVSLAVFSVPEVLRAKPVRQLKISIQDIKLQLSFILGNLWVQTDQTNDPSHRQTISSTYTLCGPASEGTQERLPRPMPQRQRRRPDPPQNMYRRMQCAARLLAAVRCPLHRQLRPLRR